MPTMFATLLVIIAIASRLLPHTSQFTALLAVSLFAGIYLSRRQALLVPVIVMVVTDIILGFHDTMFFTWGSILLISWLGTWVKTRKSLPMVFGGSVASAVIFFIITNFGAWLMMYPHTWAGISECYTLAIPFFRSTFVSTIAYSVVLYAGYEWLLKRSQGTSLARLF